MAREGKMGKINWSRVLLGSLVWFGVLHLLGAVVWPLFLRAEWIAATWTGSSVKPGTVLLMLTEHVLVQPDHAIEKP